MIDNETLKFLWGHIDPFQLSLLAGTLWTLFQGMIDQPNWTSQMRRNLAVTASVVLTGVIYFAFQYPATWDAITLHLAAVLASAQIAFVVLKQLGILDWLGKITPGGVPYKPKHEAPKEG